jgi:hypothetical protein
LPYTSFGPCSPKKDLGSTQVNGSREGSGIHVLPELDCLFHLSASLSGSPILQTDPCLSTKILVISIGYTKVVFSIITSIQNPSGKFSPWLKCSPVDRPLSPDIGWQENTRLCPQMVGS